MQRGFLHSQRRGAAALAAGFAWASVALGCAVAQGEGDVTSDHLYSEGCVDGPFDLDPDYFASSPELDTQLITVQRGDRLHDLSDGILISVYDVSAIIDEHLGQPVVVRLPSGVNPPGHAPSEQEVPLVALTLYLNDSCHEQDVSLQAIDGTITFAALFSGDLSDRKESDRLIAAEFEVTVADPRLLPADGSAPDPALISRVRGSFRFYFRRGPSAQPFP